MSPLRIGGDPGRRRRRRVAIAIVAIAAAAVIVAGWLGPRLTERPSLDLSFFATPHPTATASRRSIGPTPTPGVTALPAVTRPEGASTPGQIALTSDGFHVLDLTTGRLVSGPRALYGLDALFPAKDGAGWTCLCFNDLYEGTGPRRSVKLLTIGTDGAVISSREITTVAAAAPSETGPGGPQADVDLLPDGEHAVLAIAQADGATWRISLATLDLANGRADEPVDLGVAEAPPLPTPDPSASPAGPSDAPTPEPPPDPGIDPNAVFIDGPHIRISPRGDVAFVWGVAQRNLTTDGFPPTKITAWRIALGQDGSIGRVTDAPGFDDLPLFCGSVGFASADRLAWLCPVLREDSTPAASGAWQLSTLDLDGRAVDSVSASVGDAQYFGIQPLFDQANGQIYTWDPSMLVVTRYDAHTLQEERQVFDPAARSSSGGPSAGGDLTPDWHDANSLVKAQRFGAMDGDAQGNRLYAVGLSPDQVGSIGQSSLGIFAIDRRTLALADRWAPAADYFAVAMTAGGLVAATGVPGLDEQGRDAPWEASLTLHDPVDGRILARFGQLGSDFPFVVPSR